MDDAYRQKIKDIPISLLDENIAMIRGKFQNKGIYDWLERGKQLTGKNPVDALRKKYLRFASNTSYVKKFHMLDDFEYGDRIISPNESINDLLDSLSDTYDLLMMRNARAINARMKHTEVFDSYNEYYSWWQELEGNLAKLEHSAEDVGKLVHDLSIRDYDLPIVISALIKNKINKNLAKIGIDKPQQAPNDFRGMARYIAESIRFNVDYTPPLYP